MGRFVERNTGSIVSVADENDDSVLALGYYDRVDEKKSAPAKKAAAKKSSK